MKPRDHGCVFCGAAVLLVLASQASANTRRATWPRYSKQYQVLSYKYVDTRQDPDAEFEALAAPVQVPQAPGAAVVMDFRVPFAPNKIKIKVKWNQPGQEQFSTKFEVTTAAQGGSFTWKWPCLRLDQFGSNCCPDPPGQAESYLCCPDPEEILECGAPCPGQEFVPSELFGNPDGEDIALAGDVPVMSAWGTVGLACLMLMAGSIVLIRVQGQARAACTRTGNRSASS